MYRSAGLLDKAPRFAITEYVAGPAAPVVTVSVLPGETVPAAMPGPLQLKGPARPLQVAVS
jgi:hypothetical protein